MLAFVTVVFEPELSLLELQARSLARYASPGLVTEIAVIDNTETGIGDRRRKHLLKAYGALAGYVRFVRPSDLLAGESPSARGWVVQQILKLEISHHLESPWYVVLDAKNAAVAPLDAETFFAVDGRAKMGRHSYQDHPLRAQVAQTISQLGGAVSLIEDFPVVHTPVTLRTDIVQKLTGAIAEGDGESFAEAFIRRGFLEFPLYSAYVLATSDYDRYYTRDVVQTPTLWRKSANRVGVTEFANRVGAPDTRMMGLHRAALIRLTPGAIGTVAGLLARKGLVDSKLSGWAFLLRFKVGFVIAKIQTRIRRIG